MIETMHVQYTRSYMLILVYTKVCISRCPYLIYICVLDLWFFTFLDVHKKPPLRAYTVYMNVYRRLVSTYKRTTGGQHLKLRSRFPRIECKCQKLPKKTHASLRSAVFQREEQNGNMHPLFVARKPTDYRLSTHCRIKYHLQQNAATDWTNYGLRLGARWLWKLFEDSVSSVAVWDFKQWCPNYRIWHVLKFLVCVRPIFHSGLMG